YAYVGGHSKLNADVPPYVRADGNPAVAYGINHIGLRRAGMAEADRRLLQDAYRLLYRSALTPRRAVERIRSELPPSPPLIGLVDIVSVAVPTEQHFTVAADLLEAGIGVLVEKPIAPTVEEARELFAIARRSGAVLHVGHVERYNGAVQELKKIVERPILIESRRLGPFAPR